LKESYTSKPKSKARRKKDVADLNVKTMLEMDNILEHLSDELITKLSVEVLEGFNSDKASRSTRESRMEETTKLAMQETQKKSFPWDGCANVIIPMITTASMDFAARAYPAIIRDDQAAKSKPIGSDDGVPQVDQQGQPVMDEAGKPVMVGAGRKKAKGDRVASFHNWQLLEESENWETDTDRLLHILPVTGNVFRKWHWGDGKPESGIILPKNFIIDYFTTDLDRARKTQAFTLYEWEIEERIRSGLYIRFDIGDDPGDEAKKIAVDTRKEGAESTDADLPHAMIEQHFRYDLDGDGYEEPYIGTLHLATEKLVRLRANYESDGIKYTDEKETEIQSIKEEIYFVKYGFIPSPDGSFYDQGFGDVLFNLNETVNSIINRLLDAGTLASTSGGFLGRGLKMKGGTHKVPMGEFAVVDSRGGNIRDNFVQIQHPEPSQTLFQLLGMLIEMGKEITFSNKIMQGEQASNMPVGTVMQLVEQGMTGFKAIHKRIYRSLKKELKILYRMNELYLDKDKYARVMDMDGVNVGDFMGIEYDIVPVADPTMLTDQQRIIRAQMAAEFKDDPRVDGVKILENIFESVGLDKKLVIGNPQRQEDPLAKAQMMIAEAEQYKAQVRELEAKIKQMRTEFDMSTQQGKDIKMMAEIKKIESETIRNIAEAEAAEAGTQIEKYKAQAETLAQ